MPSFFAVSGSRIQLDTRFDVEGAHLRAKVGVSTSAPLGATIPIGRTSVWPDPISEIAIDKTTGSTFDTWNVDTSRDQLPEGQVVEAIVEFIPDAVKTSLVRGEVWATLRVVSGDTLASGWVYDHHPLTLGVIEEEGFDRVAQMDVTLTQANVAGGAIVVEVEPGAGSSYELVALRAKNSGTNDSGCAYEQAAGANTPLVLLGYVGTAVTASLNMSVGSISTTAPNTSGAQAGLGHPLRVEPGQALRIYESGAGLQNDTYRITMMVRVRGHLPTVRHDHSTNPADVSPTAGGEGFTVCA